MTMTDYERVWQWSSLKQAYRQAKKGRSQRATVLEFDLNLGTNLALIQQQLRQKTYQFGPYRQFWIHEPKKRLISAPPFPDRIVHHALMTQVIKPALEPHLIEANVANRVGMGTRQAIKIFRKHLNCSQRGDWILKGDIAGYFYHIDRDLLQIKLQKRIHCPDCLALIKKIIHSPPGDIGLPIGNLTSQYFAIYYLSAFDHFVKEQLKIKKYLRYMDDFTLIHHDKAYLQFCLAEIRNYLTWQDKLTLHPKTQIFPLQNGVDFLGFHFYLAPNHKIVMKLRRLSKNNMKRRIKIMRQASQTGEITPAQIKNRVFAWCGHAKQGNTYYLRQKLLRQMRF